MFFTYERLNQALVGKIGSSRVDAIEKLGRGDYMMIMLEILFLYVFSVHQCLVFDVSTISSLGHMLWL